MTDINNDDAIRASVIVSGKKNDFIAGTDSIDAAF
jgi:hypothetical protein